MTENLKQKWIIRIIQMRKQADSEFSLGNEGTAELFREKAEEILVKYRISEAELLESSKVEEEITYINELGITIIANPFLRINAKTDLRKPWFEKLGEIIAEAYSCKVKPTANGELKFYGYDYQREIAIFMFLRIVASAKDKCDFWRNEERKNVGRPPMKKLFSKEEITYPQEWMGDEVFNESFHTGFRDSLLENYVNHELTQEVIDMRIKVEEFFRKENPYYSSINNWGDKVTVEPAYELGRKAGRNVSKQANKSPSALATTTKSADKIGEGDISILLYDRSGSMSRKKLEFAAEGAINFCKSAIERGNSVGVISFDSNIEVVIRPTKKLTEKDEQKITKLDGRGLTNLAGAIRASLGYFTSRRVKRTICVITDGMPYDLFRGSTYAINDALTAANEAKRLGIKIMVIGTDDADEEFLKKLASEEGLGILTTGDNVPLLLGAMAEKI